VWHAGAIPAHLQGRPVYDHNPEYTLVRASHEEMIKLGELFAERLNLSKAAVIVAVPTQGLSIPSVPGGVFWNPEADADFLEALRRNLRPDFPLLTYDYHINDPVLGTQIADLFIEMMTKEKES
jgi:uncharacterized protein (UPF0261 family)